jgi:ankyrin repeat protein
MNTPSFGLFRFMSPMNAQSPLFAGKKRKADDEGESGMQKKPRRSERIRLQETLGQLQYREALTDEFKARLQDPEDNTLKQLVQDVNDHVPVNKREDLFTRFKKQLPQPTDQITDPRVRLNVFNLPVEIQERILHFKLVDKPELLQNTQYLVTPNRVSLKQPVQTGSPDLHQSARKSGETPLLNRFRRYPFRVLSQGQVDQFNLTALDAATRVGVELQVKRLLANGEKVTKETLKQAALWGEPEILDLLLENCDPILLSKDGVTLDAQTTKYKQRARQQQQEIQNLSEQSVETRRERYHETLRNYVDPGHQPLDLKGIKTSLAVLAKSGMALNQLDPDSGVSPLHNAAQRDHHSIVKMLLRAGAPVDKPAPETESTPLHLAVDSGHDRIVNLLLYANANVNAKNAQGQTPLHLAAYRNDVPIIQRLVEGGAQVNATNRNGQTPLLWAMVGNAHAAVMQLLKAADDANRWVATVDNQGAVSTPLNYAAEQRDWGMVSLLLDAGARTNEDTLICAAKNPNSVVMERLLSSNVHFDRESKMKALDRAAARDNQGVVRLLREHLNPLRHSLTDN